MSTLDFIQKIFLFELKWHKFAQNWCGLMKISSNFGLRPDERGELGGVELEHAWDL